MDLHYSTISRIVAEVGGSGKSKGLTPNTKIGGLDYNVPAVRDVCAQDLVEEAFMELQTRKELEPEYERVKAVADRWGY